MMGILCAAVGSVAARHTLAGRLSSWERKNYVGQSVSLSGGLEAAAGLVAGTIALTRRCCSSGFSERDIAAAIVASLAGAGAGYIDDHLEDLFPAKGKGFRGHLGALGEGQLTSGVLKIGVIGVGSLAAGLLTGGRMQEKAVDAALIALSANVVNLLDLRPGRARKVVVAASLCALPASPVAQVTLGAAAAGLREDLQGKKMLGDLGSNALGAHLGVALTALPWKAKCGVLAVMLGLNAAAERVSFSRIIDANPILHKLDCLGRV
ncbi:hypothetical protein [Trueperella pyogenes]|uniref:hypothetical protein n=1 Tax=Trueperella pyogenes TaxID=1661 RepID=UPI0023DDBA16|nr:hypothetical protein [Trueperella pyogenes]